MDGKTWQAVKDNLDKSFPIVGPARYQYQLKCQLEGAARLRRLAIINDVQMAPLTLPEMVVGENAFTYSDQSTGNRQVRITHRWVERSASQPPQAPPAPVYPPDGGEADGTDIVFQWTPAKDPDGDAIGDYHFELSSRADMRFPLSMCFYKLISRTADVVKEKGQAGGRDKITAKAQYTLLQPGLLTPDRRVLLARAGDGRQGRVGAVEQDLELHPARPGVSAGRDRRLRPSHRLGRCSAGKPIPSAGRRSSTASTAAMKRASRSPTSGSRAPSVSRRRKWRRGIPGSPRTSSPRRRPRN